MEVVVTDGFHCSGLLPNRHRLSDYPIKLTHCGAILYHVTLPTLVKVKWLVGDSKPLSELVLAYYCVHTFVIRYQYIYMYARNVVAPWPRPVWPELIIVPCDAEPGI